MTEAKKKSSTLRNTLVCVLVLGVIAVVCVSLLAVANKFLKVRVTLDADTAALVNQIAPTGTDTQDALSRNLITMVDFSEGGYDIKNIDDYNKKYGTATQKVRALYLSKHSETGVVTRVVEAEGNGYVGAIVMLVAYDADNKVSAVITKQQNESYWSHIADVDKLYAAFVGSSGKVSSGSLAASTGVTVSYTLGGMASAVSIANDFAARLDGTATASVAAVGICAMEQKGENVWTPEN